MPHCPALPASRVQTFWRFQRSGIVVPLLLLFLTVTAVAGCQATPTPTRAPVTIHIGGADSMDLVAQDLAAAYHELHPNVTVQVRAGNSASGLAELVRGVLDVALVARAPSAEELAPSGARAVALAQDGIAVVVHPSNPLTQLSRAQLEQVFAGQVLNWSQLTGQAANNGDAIQVVSREEGSGTRADYEGLVMNGERVTPTALVEPGEREVLEYVATHPLAIGYASANEWREQSQTKALAIDNVAPTLQSIQAGDYGLLHTLYLVVPSGASSDVSDFVKYCLSPAARPILTHRMALAPSSFSP